jgi:LysR family glycine cleavage system transcriptional activator
MTALRCFVAAARTGNFTRAADLVGLTQSAVSRQIAKLEGLLGARLFTRAGPYLQLTPLGVRYAEAIGPPLASLAAATDRFRSELDQGVVTLATLPSFGMRWLAPRLTRLAAQFPELVVNLLARSDEFDFATEIHDAAIHFGRPDWPGAECDLLFGERCIAVIAPSLFGSHGESIARVLARASRLSLVNRPDAWERWAAQTGLELGNARTSARYEHFAMLIQAAVAGAGVALIPDFLILDELAGGLLVPLSPHAIVTDDAYYLVYPAEKLETGAFRKFRSWLLEEARSGN